MNPDEFKASLGCRATGVSIVTSRHGDLVHGMTVSDFVSVSLEPPLVMVSASETANTLKFIRAGKCFALNILCAGQEDLANLFAVKGNEDLRFDGLETDKAVTGAPLIGQVEHVNIRDLEPLVYYKGKYRDFAS